MDLEKYDINADKIKKMSLSELEMLSQKLRERIIDVVSKNGSRFE